MIRAAPRLLALVGLLCASAARAAGPESPEATARVLGRAGAAVASASDLSALEENPAALAGLGVGAMTSVTAISRGDSVRGQKNRADPSVLAFVAASAPLGARTTIAAGAYESAEASYRFGTDASSFSRLVVPVGIGVQLPGVRVGVTARAERVDDAWGAAFAAGLILAPGSPVQVGAALLTPAFGDATTPLAARGGIRLRTGRFDGEVAGSYEAWSALPGRRDSGSIRAGLDVAVVPGWLVARAGWSWEPATIEPAALSSRNFDLDRTTLAAGATVCTAGFCLDLAFAHALAATHAYGGSGGELGRYEGHTDAVSLSLRLDFGVLRHTRQSATADERSH